MVEYRCFSCNRTISDQYIKKKIRCIYCGSKIIFKVRSQPSPVRAR